jgi:hypothetical protein
MPKASKMVGLVTTMSHLTSAMMMQTAILQRKGAHSNRFTSQQQQSAGIVSNTLHAPGRPWCNDNKGRSNYPFGARDI